MRRAVTYRKRTEIRLDLGVFEEWKKVEISEGFEEVVRDISVFYVVAQFVRREWDKVQKRHVPDMTLND